MVAPRTSTLALPDRRAGPAVAPDHVHPSPPQLVAARVAFTNLRSFAASSRPLVRTPEHRSSPNGRTDCTASPTFSSRKPPARNTGTRTCRTNAAETDQSCVRPVPPSSLMAALGRPLSSRTRPRAAPLRVPLQEPRDPVRGSPARSSRSAAHAGSRHMCLARRRPLAERCGNPFVAVDR